MRLLIYLAISGGLCFFMWTHLQVMRSRRISTKAIPGYERTQAGAGKWKFTVSPNVDQGKYLGTSFITLVGGFIGGFIGMMCLAVIVTGDKDVNLGLATGIAGLIVTPAIFATWLTVLWRHSAKKGFQKQTLGRPYEFVVSENELTLDGRTYPVSSIARVLTRNVMTGKESTSTTIVGTSGTMMAAGVANAITDSIRQAREAQVAAVGNMVCFEAGGNRHIIGSALNEAQAYGLMAEVGNIMGFR
ncbi:hypothetical protein [Solimonas variicoloris]|uniref:hypothetical protein n=1 Tax=Solimonas variicoloris TaxID=254408 RepID=UPI0012B63773|nr:hypothetical protein [Solimonas variicoloris]